jgi:hypothetical protein
MQPGSAACSKGRASLVNRPLSQVGSRRKRCPCQFGQDGVGSIPATPSTKHASCFPPSSMPASIEISIKLIVCLRAWSEPARSHCLWSRLRCQAALRRRKRRRGPQQPPPPTPMPRAGARTRRIEHRQRKSESEVRVGPAAQRRQTLGMQCMRTAGREGPPAQLERGERAARVTRIRTWQAPLRIQASLTVRRRQAAARPVSLPVSSRLGAGSRPRRRGPDSFRLADRRGVKLASRRAGPGSRMRSCWRAPARVRVSPP